MLYSWFLGHCKTRWRLLRYVHTMLAHWVYHFIHWASSTHLPLFTPMGSLLDSLGFLGPITISLPLMGLLLDSLGFLSPLITSLPFYYYYGLIDPYSCHVSLLSLPFYFLGFSGPFTSSLPLIIPTSLLLHSLGFLGPLTPFLPLVTFIGLLAINPATSTHRACFLISLPFCPSFLSHLPYC